MDVARAIANDMRFVDGLQQITLRMIRTDGETTVTITQAQREPVGRNLQSFAGVQLMGNETLWHFADVKLNPQHQKRVVNPNDEITHGSTVYVVLGVTKKALDTVWSCVCNPKM